jgi:hypothetical protein
MLGDREGNERIQVYCSLKGNVGTDERKKEGGKKPKNK